MSGESCSLIELIDPEREEPDLRQENYRRENQGGMVNGKPNPQAFVQDSTAQALANEYCQMPEAFHNPKAPNLVIQHENPVHRLILLYKLKGDSNREIAKKLEKSESWISQITRQPWFQTRLVQALEDTQGEILDEIVRVEATNSMFKLISLRDGAKNENVQFNAAKEIIDRHLGKTVQRTESKTNIFHVSAKLTDIEQQLAEVEQEEARLLRNGTTIQTKEEPEDA